MSEDKCSIQLLTRCVDSVIGWELDGWSSHIQKASMRSWGVRKTTKWLYQDPACELQSRFWRSLRRLLWKLARLWRRKSSVLQMHNDLCATHEAITNRFLSRVWAKCLLRDAHHSERLLYSLSPKECLRDYMCSLQQRCFPRVFFSIINFCLPCFVEKNSGLRCPSWIRSLDVLSLPQVVLVPFSKMWDLLQPSLLGALKVSYGAQQVQTRGHHLESPMRWDPLALQGQ